MFVFQNFFLTGKLRINYLSQEPHTYLNSVFTECAALYWWQVRKSDEEDKQLAHTATDAPNIMHSQHLNFRANAVADTGGAGAAPPFSAAPLSPPVNGAAAEMPPPSIFHWWWPHPPVLMQQSPSENEKNVQLLGGFAPDPHRGCAPGPRIELHRVGLLDYVYHWSTMSCII